MSISVEPDDSNEPEIRGAVEDRLMLERLGELGAGARAIRGAAPELKGLDVAFAEIAAKLSR